MAIADDGIGINPAYVSGSPQGNGITGLVRRIRELNGTVAIMPLGGGTSAEIGIPLRAGATIPVEKNVVPHATLLPRI